jgi:hypothetical protein
MEIGNNIYKVREKDKKSIKNIRNEYTNKIYSFGHQI